MPKEKFEMPPSITCRCKNCLQDITFPLDPQLFTGSFPVELENMHGNPPHRLVVYINKFFQIESFEIKEPEGQSKSESINMSEVLGAIDLKPKEIELYFRCSGKGPVSIGEMALLVNITPEEAEEFSKKFVEKGLFKGIEGTKNYFQALPPYAAIMSQLDRFADFITEIKITTPMELQSSFATFEEKAQGIQNLKEFVGYLKNIKTSVANQVNKQRGDLDKSLQTLQNQQQAIAGITTLRDKSISMVNQQLENFIGQFDSIQKKITENLEKLRLGVILKTVEDIISKVIQTELANLKQNFQEQFIGNFQTILERVMYEITKTVQSAGSISEDLRTIFSNMIGQINATLTGTEQKITGISDLIMNSFTELRNIFSEKVIITLDDVLGKIVDKLQFSKSTLQEFWDESKRVLNFAIKDIWFIRSPEGMRAQINDAVSRAKMRVLIVTPTLTEVEIEPLLKVPQFINIRICCNIDFQNPEHQKRLNVLEGKTNITYRHRDLQNLWGINRDYEEIIVGIVRKINPNEEGFDVAAIGSVLQEHIKIFVPILEDAWMGSRKDVAALAAKSELEEAESGVFEITSQPKVKKTVPIKTPLTPTTVFNAQHSTPQEQSLSEPTPVTHSPSIPPKPSQLKKEFSAKAFFDDEDTGEQLKEKRSQEVKPSIPTIQPQNIKQEIPTQPKPAALSDMARDSLKMKAEKLQNQTLTPSPVIIEPKPIPTAQPIATDKTFDKASLSENGKQIAELLDKIASELTPNNQVVIVNDLLLLRGLMAKEKKVCTLSADVKNWADTVQHSQMIDINKKNMILKRINSWKEKLFS